MNKRFLLVCLFLGLSFQCTAQKELEKALKYIEKELGLEAYMVSSQVLPFNLITVSESVIRKKYLPDYTIFKELDDAARKVEGQVNDSLDALENMLNRQHMKEHTKTSRKSSSNIKNPKFVIFFSCYRHNQLYAEVLPYDGTTMGNLPGFGTAETFYFVFSQSGVLKDVYRGSVTHN